MDYGIVPTMAVSPITVQTAGVSANTALPVNSSGRVQRIMLSTNIACAIKFGTSAGIAVGGADFIVLTPTPQIFNLTGFTHVAYLTLTAAAAISIVAVD